MSAEAFMFGIYSNAIPSELGATVADVEARSYGNVCGVHLGIKQLSNFGLKIVIHSAGYRN
jgi:hypothetical protein